LDGPSDSSDDIREISIPTTPLETQHFDTPLQPDSKNDDVLDGDIVRCICGATEVVPGDGKELIECSHCTSWQHIECIKYFCDQCADVSQRPATEPVSRHVGSQTDSGNETDQESDPRLQSAIIKIQELQESLFEKGEELQASQQLTEDLKRDKHRLELARDQRDGKCGKPIEEQMGSLEKQVHDLNTELKARHRLGTFTFLLSSSRHRGAMKDITQGFEDTHSKGRQIFRHLDIEEFSFIPQLDNHRGLLVLAQRVFGAEGNGSVLPQDIELSSYDPIVLLRSIATAALQEWVFKSDFPKFESEASVTLAAYRDLLAKQGNRNSNYRRITEV
jgi:hypothetical protein